MKKLSAAIALMACSSFASAAAGDIDVVYNVWTKHHSDSTYYSNAEGLQTYEEDNDVVGLRVGLTDHWNVGYARGENSLGRDTNVIAVELTSAPYKYLQAGFMGGMADGYSISGSSDWIFVGGPFLRAKTPLGGVTFGTYGTKAFVLTVDVPLSSSFW